MVDAYLDRLAPDRRAVMDQFREIIRSAAPEAAELIAYDMPAFHTADGRFLMSYDAYQRHYSLFPASGAVVAALGDEIAPYLSGKATLRFPDGKPIPLDLVRRVVEVRVREMAAAKGR